MEMNAQLVCHTFEEETPSPFDFEATATEHGWVMLRPFEWQPAATELSRIHRLASGHVVRLRLRDGERNPVQVIRIDVESADPLTPAAETEIRQAVRRMLRLDEDLTDFYHLATRMNGWQLRLRPGGGRLLRCPTLFEDIVYTLCTTNIAWSGTIRMVHRLTAHLGEPFPEVSDWRAFPTPAAIASAGAEFLRQETGLGYRSAYVWELAVAVVEGRLELARLEDPILPTETLHDELHQLKGVGPYAAATLLMILGRYDYLAIDTELRAHVSKKYFDGQPASEAQIRSIYAPWGAWQYLAYWFDSPA